MKHSSPQRRRVRRGDAEGIGSLQILSASPLRTLRLCGELPLNTKHIDSIGLLFAQSSIDSLNPGVIFLISRQLEKEKLSSSSVIFVSSIVNTAVSTLSSRDNTDSNS